MKQKFKFMDPQMIMTIVISLIILAVGVFAFYVTIKNIPDQNVAHKATWSAINNTSNIGNSVFNIIGIVLIIGAIMTIVGLVYSFARPGAY